MYLAMYHFDGDPTALIAAHERMLAAFPPDSLLLHAVAVGDRGIVVLDACPSRQVHAEFIGSAEFHGTLRTFGLPEPRIEVLGEVAGPVIVVPEAVRT